MGVTKNEVEYIADLANLSMSSKEIRRYQAQLSKIIQYFDTLQQLPEGRIAQGWTGPKEQLPFREDKRFSSLPVDRAIGHAQETENEQFRVPRVLEKD